MDERQHLQLQFKQADIMSEMESIIDLQFDMNLWPPAFVRGIALVSAKRRLNMDAVVLAQLVGTSAFLGT